VFLADVTPPDQRSSGMKGKADGPLITVAREAVAVSDPKHNRIELKLTDVATHEMGKDTVSNDSQSKSSQQALDAKPPNLESFTSYSMNTRELLRYRGPEWVEMGIELHRRLAFPVACMVLALVGIPLGIKTRKGGKSAGYVNAIFLAFFCYYGAWIWLTKMARTQLLPIPWRRGCRTRYWEWWAWSSSRAWSWRATADMMDGVKGLFARLVASSGARERRPAKGHGGPPGGCRCCRRLSTLTY